jgi:hypothetical protein
MNEEELKGAIIGMVLGDGHLNLSGRSTNAHMDFAHSKKQKDYAVWKSDILGQLTDVRVTEGVITVKGKEYEKVRVLSKTHPLYTHLWKRFYHNGRKTIDSFLMNQLTPLGLAIWYQDDGTLENRERFLVCLIHISEPTRH